MSRARAMFPAWLRIWHWLNAALFFTLLVTGLSLHFAGSGSGVSLRWAVRIHNLVGALLIAVYAGYLVVMFANGHFRQYMLINKFGQRMWPQVRYYLYGIWHGAHHPFPATVEARFNPMQRVGYFVIMFLVYPAQAITGVFLLFPDSAPKKVAGYGGVWPMAIAHTTLAYALTMFLIVHLYLAFTVAEPNTGVRAMVFGDRKPPVEPDVSPALDAVAAPAPSPVVDAVAGTVPSSERNAVAAPLPDPAAEQKTKPE